MSITERDIDVLNENINGKIYFAGEHTDPVYYGSLHAAYNSGVRVINEM
jgi:monoamine oxidase